MLTTLFCVYLAGIIVCLLIEVYFQIRYRDPITDWQGIWILAALSWVTLLVVAGMIALSLLEDRRRNHG